MNEKNNKLEIKQFSFWSILLPWAAAALPMGILGWIVAPFLSRNATNPGIVRIGMLSVGLIWQCLLTLLLLRKQEGKLTWSILKRRLWLLKPSSIRTREEKGLLFIWVIPLLLITALYEMKAAPAINHYWTSIFPFLKEPASFSLSSYLESANGKAQLIGAWGTFFLFIVNALFNTFIGEELFFRGMLLPRMNGVFGKFDWAANGLLFGLYHLHQPWGILSGVVSGIFLYALPTKAFRSSWFGIILHSGQSVFFAFIILSFVLGIA